MTRLRLLRKASVHERVPLPHPLGWATAAAVTFAAAAALFSSTGNGGLVAVVPAWLDPVARGQAPVLAAALIAVGGILATRRALFARLARKPGPIEIISLSGGGDAPSADGAPAAEQILADFRQMLTSMSLSTTQSVPNTPSADTLLDDVKTAVDTSKNAVATAAALVRAMLQVRHAYRVSVQIRSADGGRRHGLTVHVVTLPGGDGAVESFWSEEWSEATEMAAHFVGSFVLPRSRLADLPPWTGWRGLNMPWLLFHHSQLARRHLRSRRYERALDAYHSALKIDPQNPYLRIETGQVQEQMGLLLDALATFADVVAVESWYDRRLWIRLRRLFDDDNGEPPPSWTARSPHGREGLLIARYRLVGLACADELGEQWMQVNRPDQDASPGNPRRSIERRAIADRLLVWLRSYAVHYQRSYGVAITFGGRSSSRVRHLLQYVSYCEVMHLVHDYRWYNGRRRIGMTVTQTSLNVMQIWSRVYLDYATYRWANIEPAGGWPPKAEDLGRRIALTLGRKPSWAREWQEHYNAACTFAVALQTARTTTSAVSDDNRAKLVTRAVRCLERAVSSTDSGYVGAYAQWLSTGDPDLNALRPTADFIAFLDRYLPNPETRVTRPRKLVRLIMSQHSSRLVRDYARERAGYWSDQLRATTGPAGRPLDELDREVSVRALVVEFAANYQDWRTRLDLIDEAQDFVRRAGRKPLDSALPQFQDDPAVRRHVEGGPRIDGREVDYPDGYFRDVVARRNDAWSAVITAVDVPLPPVDVDLRAQRLAALSVWREVDRILSRALLDMAPPDVEALLARAAALQASPLQPG